MGHNTATKLLSGQLELSCAAAQGTGKLTKHLLKIPVCQGLQPSERIHPDFGLLLASGSQSRSLGISSSYPCEICGVKAEVNLGSPCQDHAITKKGVKEKVDIWNRDKWKTS